MKKKTIFDRLEELAYHASQHIDRLNCGGCAVFAHMVGDRLYRMPVGDQSIELLGYAVNGWCRAYVPSVSATYLPATVEVSIDELRHIVKDRWCARTWNKAGLKLSHIGAELRIDGMDYIFDSSGIALSDDHPEFVDRVPGRLERTELMLMALQPLGWNTKFDRQQMAFIKSLVKAFLPYPGEERKDERFRARIRKASKEMGPLLTGIPLIDQWVSLPKEKIVQYQEIRELRREILSIPDVDVTSAITTHCEVV